MPKTKLTLWPTTDGRFAPRKVNSRRPAIFLRRSRLFWATVREARKKYCETLRMSILVSIRTTHIEVAESLETDSFINALRRFISRRGMPKVIRSDNITNLCGGERELREAAVNWNQQKIRSFLLQRNIDWKFNPPEASQMGGVWERIIRSVRKILRVLLREQLLSGEVLRMLMSEVESILNGRPLTPNSDDPADMEPLIPNHLLLL